MKNLPLLIGTLLGTLILVVGLAFFFSRPEPAKVVDTGLVIGVDRPAKGPENAKVTVVEFSDFQCPSCRAAQPLVEQIIAKYPNDVRFIYRHYPLPTIHKNAEYAAQAAEAARSFDKFWELHDLLFAEQPTWSELDGDERTAKFDEYLQKLGIDKSQFVLRMESKEVKDAMTTDVADGTRAGVNGTPTFFVNGQLTSAPQLLQTVESALSAN
ncbi:thioredoxin domain-containing protein [Patescibacteria group bacterium]|nr:thioredoxin domain-containing protein [Patescibacteria group bacterium]